MAKKKEWYMDYATHAFVIYASLGCPTRQQYEEEIRRDVYRRSSLLEPGIILIRAESAIRVRRPVLEDIDAVNKVLDILREQGKQHIIDAMKAVYFYDPHGKPEHGEIVNRVIRFSVDYPASERAVYKWLKSVRLLFAQVRGLDTGATGEKW